jgi:hypothetical protein
MFGLGKFVDPLGNAKASIATALKKINQQTAVNSLAAQTLNSKVQMGIVKFMIQANDKMTAEFQDGEKEDNQVFFFFLFRKNKIYAGD